MMSVSGAEVWAAHKAMADYQYGSQFDPDMDRIGWSLDQLEAGIEAAIELREQRRSAEKEFVESSFYSSEEGR